VTEVERNPIYFSLPASMIKKTIIEVSDIEKHLVIVYGSQGFPISDSSYSSYSSSVQDLEVIFSP
jgi:hypothetical protein